MREIISANLLQYLDLLKIMSKPSVVKGIDLNFFIVIMFLAFENSLSTLTEGTEYNTRSYRIW